MDASLSIETGIVRSVLSGLVAASILGILMTTAGHRWLRRKEDDLNAFHVFFFGAVLVAVATATFAWATWGGAAGAMAAEVDPVHVVSDISASASIATFGFAIIGSLVLYGFGYLGLSIVLALQMPQGAQSFVLTVLSFPALAAVGVTTLLVALSGADLAARAISG